MSKKQIPIKTSSWNEKRIGFGELDNLTHRGSPTSKEFVCFLTYTDIVS